MRDGQEHAAWKLGIACFTEQGRELALRIAAGLDASCEILWYEKGLKQWCGRCFAEAKALIFIGACGIAVRSIAPFLKSKTEDPAVLVLDEKGQYVISLLSGHIGGANALACRVAEIVGASPVITTASDVRGKLAVDVFAKNNALALDSMKGAKEIAAAILREEQVYVCCTGRIEGRVPPELTLISEEMLKSLCSEPVTCPRYLIWISERRFSECEFSEHRALGCRFSEDEVGQLSAPVVLSLIPQVVAIGIGCRKGKDSGGIEQTVREILEEEQIPLQAVCGAASIDLKKDEAGILETCRRLGISFTTFSAETLGAVPGEFSASEFVRRTTGVDNVCERAALVLAGSGGRLIRRKYARDGVTVALAMRAWDVCFDEKERAAETCAAAVRNDKKTERLLGSAGGKVLKNKLYVIGMGPGAADLMSQRADRTLADCDTIIGYTVYVNLLKETYPEKEFLTTPMTQEAKRCEMAFEEAAKGKKVAMVCSGDAGVYGMSGLMLEIGAAYPEIEVEVISGVTAALSGGAVLGAPLTHDFAVISLSDRLTPWDKIEKRLRCAAEADFSICLYNPASKGRPDYLKRACEILLEVLPKDRICGTVENIGREGESAALYTLEELKDAKVNMFTTVFIGNSMTKEIGGRMVTPRGYRI